MNNFHEGMKYKFPDIIQRIYSQSQNGDNSKYQEVLTDLRAGKREFQMEFDFKERKVFWTCFEASRYADVIMLDDNYVYFYLADSQRDLEIVIPGHTYADELKKPILERTPFCHCIWVLGQYFPGLQSISGRPIKIHLQPLRMDWGPIKSLNYWFKKMLLQYDSLNKPIFEAIDYPKEGKSWKKIVKKDNRNQKKNN
jgi:hypothetical protein